MSTCRKMRRGYTSRASHCRIVEREKAVAITALFAYRKGPVAQVAPPISAAKVILAANVYQLPRKGYLFAANVYPQDELRGANKDALFAVNKVELRGVKEVIRSFRRFKKSAGDLRFLPCASALTSEQVGSAAFKRRRPLGGNSQAMELSCP